MTAALQVVPSPRAAPASPDPHPDTGLLAITADSVHPGAVVIRVRGGVDLVTSPLLLDALLAQLQGPARRLIVDLTAVGFFGAAGLTVLATAKQGALAVGVGLCLVVNTRPVLLPLTITGMHTQFDIYPGLAQALRCAASGQGG